MPKLAIGSWAFAFGPFARAPWPFSRVLEFAAAAGYDGIEINGFRPHPHQDDFASPERCRDLLGEIADWGLGISGFAPSFAATPPAEVEAKTYLDVFGRCLTFCERCGIHTLRVDTVSPPSPHKPDEYEERFARLARTWALASREARRCAVDLVWEFEPGFWLNRPSEVLRLVKAVGEPNFGVLFDTSHAYMGGVMGARHVGAPEILAGGVAEYARLLGGHIRHLHLIDSDGTLHNGETSVHAPFGRGRIDFPAVLAALRPGVALLPWWCVDLCFNADAEEAAMSASPIVRQWMKETP